MIWQTVRMTIAILMCAMIPVVLIYTGLWLLLS